MLSPAGRGDMLEEITAIRISGQGWRGSIHKLKDRADVDILIDSIHCDSFVEHLISRKRLGS